MTSPNGEANFWIEPELVLANNQGMTKKDLKKIEKENSAKIPEIKEAWKKHFAS